MRDRTCVTKGGCDRTQVLTGSFQGQSGSGEASKETLTLTRGLVGWTRELVMEVVSSDLVLDIERTCRRT